MRIDESNRFSTLLRDFSLSHSLSLVHAPLAFPFIINLSLLHPLSLISFSTYPPLFFSFCLFFCRAPPLTLSSYITLASPSVFYIFFILLHPTFLPLRPFFSFNIHIPLAFLLIETYISLLCLSAFLSRLLNQSRQMVVHPGSGSAGAFFLLGQIILLSGVF